MVTSVELLHRVLHFGLPEAKTSCDKSKYNLPPLLTLSKHTLRIQNNSYVLSMLGGASASRTMDPLPDEN
jgi:hypothetical protein